MKIVEQLIRPKKLELLKYLNELQAVKVIENANGSAINLDVLNDFQIDMLLEYTKSLAVLKPEHKID